MARIKVPQQDGEIVVFDGARTAYKVKDGVIAVDDVHVLGVLAGVHGAELIPESEKPIKSGAPEKPAKESN